MGTQLESRPRYTPTTCFETFPFPEPDDAQRKAIGDAAARLNELREGWLNPLDANFNQARAEKDLRRRTLTNLYNQAPHLAEQRSHGPRHRRGRGLRMARRPPRRRHP